MCQCTLCKKLLNHEIAFEFNYYYGSGINRIWNGNDNQNIKTFKTMDCFCSKCAEYISEFQINAGYNLFTKNMNNVYEKKVNEEATKDPDCFFCKKKELSQYYGICFEKIFLTEQVNEIYDSFFVGAVCESCHNSTLKNSDKNSKSNLRYLFLKNSFNQKIYYSDNYPLVLQ